MCAFSAVWTNKAFDIDTNLVNFMCSDSSSANLRENMDNANLPLQTTLWLKMCFYLIQPFIQQSHSPNGNCISSVNFYIIIFKLLFKFFIF